MSLLEALRPSLMQSQLDIHSAANVLKIKASLCKHVPANGTAREGRQPGSACAGTAEGSGAARDLPVAGSCHAWER